MQRKYEKKILIADDDPISRTLISNSIESAGYLTVTVENGKQVIESLSSDIGVAILDLRMPEMDGMECLQYINNNFNEIQTVIATASNDISDAVEAMKIGAFDYITKPFDPKELIIQVRKALSTHEQLLRLKKIESELERSKELESLMASRIQQALLLGDPPKGYENLTIASMTRASQNIDGDFYDFFELNDKSFDIIVGDVMGKGIQAALLGAAAKNQLLRALNAFKGIIPTPDAIVSSVNSKMIDELEILESFITLCYVRFDLEKSLLYFVDCGHTRTIHFHGRSGTLNFLKGYNMPLGFPENEPFLQNSVPLYPGDLFIFYSDGITETRNLAGAFYGEKRLVDLVKKNSNERPKNLVKNILKDVMGFSGSETLADDITCVAVKIDEEISSDYVQKERKIIVDSDLKTLERVRAFIRQSCQYVPGSIMDLDRIFLLELAVTEVVSNIIKHAYHNQEGKKIHISTNLTDDHFEVILYDWGDPFDQGSVPPPVFDGTKESGFGLHIITESVDGMFYSRDDNGRNQTVLLIIL